MGCVKQIEKYTTNWLIKYLEAQNVFGLGTKRYYNKLLLT